MIAPGGRVEAGDGCLEGQPRPDVPPKGSMEEEACGGHMMGQRNGHELTCLLQALRSMPKEKPPATQERDHQPPTRDTTSHPKERPPATQERDEGSDSEWSASEANRELIAPMYGANALVVPARPLPEKADAGARMRTRGSRWARGRVGGWAWRPMGLSLDYYLWIKMSRGKRPM